MKETHLQVETMPLDELLPYADNARLHSAEQIDTIAASIEQFGFNDPVGVWTNGDGELEIVEGHGRVMAARSLGYDEVPTINLDHLTDEQRRAYAIVHNQTTDSSEWDYATLDAELSALDFDWGEFGLEVGGDDWGGGSVVVEADIPETVEQRVSRGDVWRLGPHRVMCGDATSAGDVDKLIGGDCVEMILTDPPYCSGGFQEAGKASGSIGTRDNILIANDCLSTRGYGALIKQTLANVPGAAIAYVFTDWRMWVNLYDIMEGSGFGVRNMIVWDKGTPGMGVGWRHQHELCMLASRSRRKFNCHKAQGNVIECGRTGNVNHPTEKPVELFAKIIDVTDFCDRIYDPFGGSGTTMIAAEQMGRACYTMEIDPNYCDLMLSRWEKLTGGEAEKVE